LLKQFYHAMLCIAETVLLQAVCLYICLSVTRQYSVKMAKSIIKLFHNQVAMPF